MQKKCTDSNLAGGRAAGQSLKERTTTECVASCEVLKTS